MYGGGKEVNFVRCLKCQKILECSRYDTPALLQHIRDDHPEVDIDHHGAKGGVKHTNDQRPKAAGGARKSTGGTNNKTTDQTTAVNHKVSQRDKAVGVEQKSKSDKELGTDTDHSFECRCTNNQKAGGELNDKPNTNTGNAEYQGLSMDLGETGHPYYVPEDDLTHYSIKSDLVSKYPEIKNSEFCPRNPNANVIYTRRYKIKTPSTTGTTTTFASVPRTPRKRHLYRTSIEKWRPANGTIYCPKCGTNKRPLVKTKTEHFTQNEWLACCLLSCWPLCFLPCLLPGKEAEYLHCSNCKTFLGVFNRSSNCIKPNRDYMTNGTQMNIKLKNAPENGETVPKSISEKSTSTHLPSIVIDGKELHPDMVARLQHYKKFGSLVGIDLEAFTDDDAKSKNTGDYIDSFRDGIPSTGAPSIIKRANNKAFW